MLPKGSRSQKLTESGVIAVIRRIPETAVEPVAESLMAGGITALEVTVDSPNAFAVIRRLSDRLKDRAIIGAGTVLDAASARLAIDSGAEFLLSPGLHRDVIQTAHRYGTIAVPGVLTPTEMIAAVEWGADLVKIFPASVFGPSYIRAVKAPFPHIPVIPTGGIHLDNLASYIQAGAAAVGVGGNLLDRRWIQAGDFSKIMEMAKQYARAAQQARR